MKLNSIKNEPKAKSIPKVLNQQNDERVDEFFWLRQRDSDDVLNYLKEENSYTAAVMQPAEKLQEEIYKEIIGRIKETDTTAPTPHDDYVYYKRTLKGKNYFLFCRRSTQEGAEEEVLLDVNDLAEGTTYFSTGAIKVSPDHTMLAYSSDTNGSESYTIFVKDLSNGKVLHETIENTYPIIEWGNDSKHFYYVTLDAVKRPYRILQHQLGQDLEEDKLIHQDEDERFFVYLSKSRDKKYIFVHSDSKTISEIHYINANDPRGTKVSVEGKHPDLEYSIEHHENYFYLITNLEAKNFRVMRCPVDNTQMKAWEQFGSHDPQVKIDSMDIFKEFMVVYQRKSGLKELRVVHMPSGDTHLIQLPEPLYDVYKAENFQFDTNQFRFRYSSLATPERVYDYDFDKRQLTVAKQQQIKGGFQRDNYDVERHFATAKDGTTIPISLVYRKDSQNERPRPLYLYGYGSYGISMDPTFAAYRLSLLDRGFTIAVAHIRGGGELGREWYESGRQLVKKNTFSDFISCAEYLIDNNYTTTQKLVIGGGSAGGLLMGAVLNMRPELFRAAVAKVPFVDNLNTMLDPSLPLTVTEYDEWGNPNDQEVYDYIKSYAPYENVEAKHYPNILVTAGLYDPRVSYWEPAKWVARLRKLKTDNNILILKTNMDAGHGGASGRYDFFREVAFEYAFIVSVVD